MHIYWVRYLYVFPIDISGTIYYNKTIARGNTPSETSEGRRNDMDGHTRAGQDISHTER